MSRVRMRSSSLRIVAAAVLAGGISPLAARATAVDFSTFTPTSGVPANTFSTPNWQIATSYNNKPVDANRVVQELGNSDTTLFLGPASLSVLNTIITGDVYFGSDDDPVGIALGVPQDPFTNPAAEYILIQWKGVDQTFDFNDVAGSGNTFHNTTVGGFNPAGLSISRVQGVPTADELWQRASLTMYDPTTGNGTGTAPDPATSTPLGFDTGGLTELARGATKGSTPYDRTGRKTSFEITYTPTNITVKFTPFGGPQATEFNINASSVAPGYAFPTGTLGLYEQGQDGQGAFAYFDVRGLGDPPPPSSPDLSPAGLPFAAADVSVTEGNTNATSVWTVTRGTAANPVTIPSAANIGDVDFAINGNRITNAQGVLFATVRQNGPRGNNAAPTGPFYAGVEAPSPSGFNLSSGLATFPYVSSTGEWNVNVAVAHFPYATFHGGYANYTGAAGSRTAALRVTDSDSLYTLTTIPMALPSVVQYDPNFVPFFWSATAGVPQQTIANLAIAGVHSATGPGLLFTIGSANENNTVTAAVLPNGSWNIAVRDSFRPSYGGPDTFEEDNFTWVYVEPGKVAESAGARVTGLAVGVPQVAQSWGNYTLDHVRPGVYELNITGGESYTINALEMKLGGSITPGDPNANPVVNPVNNQTLTPTLADTSFSVAFMPFNPGDPSAGMLLLTNNGTRVAKDVNGNDVTVPTNFFLTYQTGGVPTWRSAGSGTFSDPANWRGGAPAAGGTANLSRANTTPATVTLPAGTTSLANLYFNSPTRYTLAGGTLSFTGELGAFGGSHEVTAPVQTAGGAILVANPGTHLKLTGTLAGKLSALSVTDGSGLDLVSNTNLVIDYAGPSPADALNAALFRHSQGATVGLYSSVADADPQNRKAIGYAEASTLLGLSGADTTTYNGQTVDATTLLTKLTWYGDANLDGVINRDDFALIDRGMAMNLTGWVNGDFNFDSLVNSLDYALIDRVFAQQGGVLSPELLAQRQAQFGPDYVSSLLASVPEPSSLAAACALAFPALRRRRRRRPSN